MSNTSKGKAQKGSKLWMQLAVNTIIQNDLNTAIGDDLKWLSPLSGDDNYSEYELRQEYICSALGISNQQKETLFSFWPSRQPQWDGIALSNRNSTLYLVEAKAHLSELTSKLSATNEKSVAQIKHSLQEVHDRFYPDGDFRVWTDDFYQLANRLTFLHKLNEKTDIMGREVKLVLLNFVDDYTYRPTTINEWKQHYEEVFTELIGSNTAPKNVMLINFPVNHYTPT